MSLDWLPDKQVVVEQARQIEQLESDPSKRSVPTASGL